jgi:hypothetical protein
MDFLTQALALVTAGGFFSLLSPHMVFFLSLAHTRARLDMVFLPNTFMHKSSTASEGA